MTTALLAPQTQTQIVQGDCIAMRNTLAVDSVDAIVTDPPYNLGFMGKGWDTIDAYEDWCRYWATAALSVCKPGAHLVAFGGTRTFHRLTCALEDAGWDVRDCLMWVYGTGFPHGINVSKAIDKALGAEREKVRVPASEVRNPKSINGGHGIPGGDRPWMRRAIERGYHEMDSDTPVSDEAARYEGFNTGLKPAFEPVILCRKPLEGTVAQNVLKYGTGALNIGACRLEGDLVTTKGRSDAKHAPSNSLGTHWSGVVDETPHGRWPANVILDEDAAALLDAQSGFTQSPDRVKQGRRSTATVRFGTDCVREVPGYGDAGGASRFFYCPKASKAERGEGNNHTTVKPLDLMRWLCRLVTPPGGFIVDPFAGSGTTLLAARAEGFRSLGIEQSQEYVEIATRRLQAREDIDG